MFVNQELYLQPTRICSYLPSVFQSIKASLPTSCVLVPKLFLLHVNDFLFVPSVFIHSYADHPTLYPSLQTPHQLLKYTTRVNHCSFLSHIFDNQLGFKNVIFNSSKPHIICPAKILDHHHHHVTRITAIFFKFKPSLEYFSPIFDSLITRPSNPTLKLASIISTLSAPSRRTKCSIHSLPFAIQIEKSQTTWFVRYFSPSKFKYWNLLPADVFHSPPNQKTLNFT